MISIPGASELARMECAEGNWRVRKRLALGWELVIESLDERHVGRYSGRRLVAGGTISLINGTQTDLRRRLPGVWKLQTVDTHERIVDMHGYGASSTALTIRSLPIGVTDPHVMILTACAVMMLERTLRVPRSSGI